MKKPQSIPKWLKSARIKKWVKRRCESLPFVKWDRFAANDEVMTVYGWIERDKDSYKDFVALYFYEDGSIDYDTSSALYSKEIHKIIWEKSKGHVNCVRVENVFDVENSIRIKTEKTTPLLARGVKNPHGKPLGGSLDFECPEGTDLVILMGNNGGGYVPYRALLPHQVYMDDLEDDFKEHNFQVIYAAPVSAKAPFQIAYSNKDDKRSWAGLKSR